MALFLAVYLVTLTLAVILVWSELKYFVNPNHNFNFVPDTDFEAKLQINIDITIAMPCDSKY